MIIDLDGGRKINIEKYNLKRLFHYIPSVTVSNISDTADGRAGSVFIDTQYVERIITVRFLFEVYDIQDYYLLRDELNALFVRRDAYYIIFTNEPYKRYKVRLNGNYLVPPTPQGESFEIEFICEDLYGEAIATTLSLKEWDAENWGWNGAITWDDELKYSFNTNRFTVINLGTAVVDPRHAMLNIYIRGNFTQGLTLRNITTGDVYEFYNPIRTGDELALKGVQSFKNYVSVFSLTNKKLITLAVGENYFVVSGDGIATVEEINFNFRFLYL